MEVGLREVVGFLIGVAIYQLAKWAWNNREWIRR